MVQTIIYALSLIVFLIDAYATIGQNRLLKRQNEYLVKYLGIKSEASEEKRKNEKINL